MPSAPSGLSCGPDFSTILHSLVPGEPPVLFCDQEAERMELGNRDLGVLEGTLSLEEMEVVFRMLDLVSLFLLTFTVLPVVTCIIVVCLLADLLGRLGFRSFLCGFLIEFDLFV